MTKAKHIHALIGGVIVLVIGIISTFIPGWLALSTPYCLDSIIESITVLFISLLVESFSLFVAWSVVLKQYRKLGVKFNAKDFLEYFMFKVDPVTNSIFLQELISVVGLVTAASAVVISHYLSSSIPDAIGSFIITTLLVGALYIIIKGNIKLLIGRSISHKEKKILTDVLEDDKIIRSVHDIKATQLGTNLIMFKAEINYDGRQVTRAYLTHHDIKKLFKIVESIKNEKELVEFLEEYGEGLIDWLGYENDRIETKLKEVNPDVRHADLEIL